MKDVALQGISGSFPLTARGPALRLECGGNPLIRSQWMPRAVASEFVRCD